MLNLSAFLVADDFEKWLASLNRSFPQFFLAAGRILGQSKLGQEGSRLVILILRPAFERVIMALIATEPHSQEQLRRVFHRVLGRAADLEIGSGWVFPIGSGGGENLADKFVVWRVGTNLSMDPLAEGNGTFYPQELAVDQQ